MDTRHSVEVAHDWQEAANRQDVARLLQISAADIEISGPRGSGHGHKLLQDWLERAGLVLETLRVFGRGEIVVLAQHGVWHAPGSGEVTGESDLASLIEVRGDKVVRVARYSSLLDALEKAGLDYTDEVPRS